VSISMRCKPTIIFLLSLLLIGCAKEDPNDKANALFVEATKIFGDPAKAQTDEMAASMYRNGLAKLDEIVAKYPTSNLAVQLASGQQVGNFGRNQRQVQVQSGSMNPTLQKDDKVVVFKYADGSMPKRGDVVTFLIPKSGLMQDIKRVVGLPDDRIQMIDGVLNINGIPVKRERAPDHIETFEGIRSGPVKQWKETLPNGVSYYTLDLVDNGYADNTQVYTVPFGHYFMMGDNRDNSTDSRFSPVGFIPLQNIIGRAIRP
jgi:signal peptidase I